MEQRGLKKFFSPPFLFEKIMLLLSVAVIIGFVAYKLYWEYRPPPVRQPSAAISSGREKVDSAAYTLATDMVVYQRDLQDDFRQFMKGKKLSDLRHVRNGESVTIRWNSRIPDSIALTEYIMSEDGEFRDGSGVAYDVLHKRNANSLYFKVEPNWATALGSYSGDYTPGFTIKGYQLVAVWGDLECVYLFVIRGDAGTRTMSGGEGGTRTMSRGLLDGRIRGRGGG